MVLEAAGAYYEEVGSLLAEPLEKSDFISRVEDRLGKVKAHRKKMKEAADIGTQVHKRIEWELRGILGKKRSEEEPSLDHPKAVRSYERWQEWCAVTRFKPLEIEIPVASQVFKFGGTADLLAEVNDPDLGPGIEVIDWKTGKHIYDEALLQNAAYRVALKEMGISNDRGRIVRLPKEVNDPEFEAKLVPSLDEVIVPFLSLIPVWRWHHEQEVRRLANERGPAANVA